MPTLCVLQKDGKSPGPVRIPFTTLKKEGGKLQLSNDKGEERGVIDTAEIAAWWIEPDVEI
jgi:hypothetical protein